MWGRVAPPPARGIRSLDAYLLSVKYMYVNTGAEMPPEKGEEVVSVCLLYTCSLSPAGAALPWPWHLRPTHPSTRLV